MLVKAGCLTQPKANHHSVDFFFQNHITSTIENSTCRHKDHVEYSCVMSRFKRVALFDLRQQMDTFSLSGRTE